jgi:DNA-binding transcriptional MocR family regulator
MSSASSANQRGLVQNLDGRELARLLRPRLSGSGSLRERLAAAIREAAASGALAAGARLAPERELADSLGISRGTVVAAYRELAEAGVVERRQGSGTWLREGDGRPVPSRGRSGVYGLAPPEPGTRAAIDLSVAGPQAPPGVARALAALGADDVGGLGHGYGVLGVPTLREELRRHLERWGVPTADEELLVTCGAQQAIALVASARLRPGEPVVVEDPTYVGALDAVTVAGGRPVPVGMDEAGIRPEAMREAVAASGARIAYLVPTGQNPTGTVMPERRRAEVVAVARDLGLTLVEDCTLHDLTLRGTWPGTLAALAPEAGTLLVGSLSKLLWGGLRVGWVRGPAELIERLSRLKLAMDHGSPGVSQLVGARLLADAEAHRERARGQLAVRVAAVTAAFGELLPEWRFRPPEAGLSLWVRLPGPEATPFARLARAMGVAVVPGPVVSAEARFEDHLRLALVHEPPVLREAVARLAEAWRVYVPTGGVGRAPVALV